MYSSSPAPLRVAKSMGFSGTPQKHMGSPYGTRGTYTIRDPYHSQSRIPKDMGVEPKIGGFYPQNGWFIMENPMNKRMIWGENHLFLETPILGIVWVPLTIRGSHVLGVPAPLTKTSSSCCCLSRTRPGGSWLLPCLLVHSRRSTHQ